MGLLCSTTIAVGCRGTDLVAHLVLPGLLIPTGGGFLDAALTFLFFFGCHRTETREER